MRRVFQLTVLSLAIVGVACQPPLICGVPLDATDFGFTFSVPDTFACDASLPAPDPIRGFVVYREAGSDTQLAILVADASNDNIDPSGTGATSADSCTDIGDYTNGNGITFQRCMFAGDQGVSYAGFVELPGGTNRLLISLIAPADDPSLDSLLNQALDGVAF